jgi:hypothetical protein
MEGTHPAAIREFFLVGAGKFLAGGPSLHCTTPTEWCPILAFCARVGGDAAGATLVRSTLPVVYAVVVPALRKVREGRGTRSCGGFCSLKAGHPPD